MCCIVLPCLMLGCAKLLYWGEWLHCAVLDHAVMCCVVFYSTGWAVLFCYALVCCSLTLHSWAASWHLVTCSCSLWRSNAWSHWAAMCCNLMLCSVGLHCNMCSVGLHCNMCSVRLHCDMMWYAVALCDIVTHCHTGLWCAVTLCCDGLHCVTLCSALSKALLSQAVKCCVELCCDVT